MQQLTDILGLGGLTEANEFGSEFSCGGVLPKENRPGVLGGSEVGDNVDGLVHCGLCLNKIEQCDNIINDRYIRSLVCINEMEV